MENSSGTNAQVMLHITLQLKQILETIDRYLALDQ